MTDYVLQQIVNALSAGSLYALMAVGLAMVFGILRLINFAHGDVMMIAAYIAVFCLGAGLPLPVALAIMIVGTIVVGLLMERVAYRPLRGAPEVALLLTSFAVGQILQNGTLLLTRLAGEPIQIAFPRPDVLNGVVTIGAITIPKVNVAQLRGGRRRCWCCSPLFVTRTTLGLSMRAAAEDLAAARLMGIRVNRVVATAFAIAAGLAAVAGFLYAVAGRPDQPVHGLHAGAQGVHRGGHRRLRQHRRRGPGRLRAGVPGGPRRPRSFGIGDIIPAGLRPARGARPPRDGAPEPTSPAIATRSCSSFLILVLLFRPNGLLGGAGARGRRCERNAAAPRTAPAWSSAWRLGARWLLDAAGRPFWQGLAINLGDLHRS